MESNGGLFNVKKIYIIGICIVVLLATSIIAGKVSSYFTQKRANELYQQLEDRYSDLEQSNRELREIESELTINYNKLREQVKELNGDIGTARGISEEFEKQIAGARDTVERIEITVSYIEKLVGVIPEEIKLLEDSNSNR